MNLFVYGTLISEQNQKIVTSHTFRSEKAVLKNYRKVTSRACFPFIIPYFGEFVDGYILYDVDAESMLKMDKYEAEGDLYWRRTVKVYTEGNTRPVECEVYIGNVKSIKKYFLPGTDIEDRIEKYVASKVNELMMQDSLKDQDVLKASEYQRIKKELLGSDFEDLVRSHIEHRNLSLEYLSKNLAKKELPTLKPIRNNPAILAYADNYISFAVKHMIFNQIEDRIRFDFTGRVKVEHEFYAYTISIMIALTVVNERSDEVAQLMKQYKADTFNDSWEYVDYAHKAIKIADTIYDKESIERKVEWVKKNRHPGVIPLGAEVEFSTGGRFAVEKERPFDSVYNYFHYFHDFDFTGRMWKIGGHIDDHHFPDPLKERSFGFLEYAFGRSKIFEDLSKPVTLDPWILDRLINEATRFTGIRPHSLHISIQAAEKVQFTRQNDIDHLICLLLLGGDLGYDTHQILREKRIFNREIVDEYGFVRFSLENIHCQDRERQHKTTVVEYLFARLYVEHNYQPLIMALKGYQLAVNPRPLCPADGSEKMGRYEMEHLKFWAEHPYPLQESKINEFVEIVEHGLMTENENGPAHKITYIRKNISDIARQIKAKNKFLTLN
ncbi:MAG: gamma-glutamylcyclotransferase family protein [Candidatus Auribacterota bacterium]|jgi:gamma-glutamylcyclotransferase (GGCT)/AIG2-like uncharacterized protein YtfP|nr:gamma-glutamylcyclotransferase family protein [Candidatus Auribacterota bacterium]